MDNITKILKKSLNFLSVKGGYISSSESTTQRQKRHKTRTWKVGNKQKKIRKNKSRKKSRRNKSRRNKNKNRKGKK